MSRKTNAEIVQGTEQNTQGTEVNITDLSIQAGNEIAKADRKTYIESQETLIGERKRELLDTETGEKILVDQITKRVYGTKQFWKVYLMDFLYVLGILDSKQLDIFIYIAENTNQSNNTFIGTYDKISADTGTSRPTVSRLMHKLQSKGFIKKVQNGVWLVNPNILMKGNDSKRQILLTYFEAEEPVSKLTYARTQRALIENETDNIPTEAIEDKENQDNAEDRSDPRQDV